MATTKTTQPASARIALLFDAMVVSRRPAAAMAATGEIRVRQDAERGAPGMVAIR